MNGEVRALLLYLADSAFMTSDAVVSIPQKDLTEVFDVPKSRISERIKRAHELGLLVTVEKGIPGRTATYQGTIPGGTETTGWRGPGSVTTEPTGSVKQELQKGSVTTEPESAISVPSRRGATGSRDNPSLVDVPPLMITPAAATDEVIREVIQGEIVHDARTTQTLIGEYVEHCPQKPPSQVIGQLAKTIKRMLVDDGIDYDRVREGLAEWHRRGLHPSVLPSIIHELSTPRTRPRPNNHQQQTDDMFARAYARAQAGQNVFLSTTREIEAS